MATALEYGIIAAGVAVVVIATVNAVFERKEEKKGLSKPAVTITMVTPQPAAPMFLPQFLVPDLSRMKVWGKT